MIYEKTDLLSSNFHTKRLKFWCQLCVNFQLVAGGSDTDRKYMLNSCNKVQKMTFGVTGSCFTVQLNAVTVYQSLSTTWHIGSCTVLMSLHVYDTYVEILLFCYSLKFSSDLRKQLCVIPSRFILPLSLYVLYYSVQYSQSVYMKIEQVSCF